MFPLSQIDVRNLKNGDLKAKIIPKSDTNNSENSVVSVQFLNSNDSGLAIFFTVMYFTVTVIL